MATATYSDVESRFTSKLRAMKKAGNISSVRMLVKLFELQTMSEGRKMKILLLDGRKLEMLIKPKLLADELLDMVASHFNLKEKEYFGLQFKDSLGKNHWLQPDRQVLDHSFPKTSDDHVISFGIRFYVESVSQLRDDATLELFFLQARQSIYEGRIECENDSVFMLAAYALQSTFSDYTDDKTAKSNLKTLCVLPTSTFKEFPSLSYCEDRILAVYRNLRGHTRTSSMQSYMSIVEQLPMYGVHYAEVKDRSGLPWWLGVSHKGISLYDFNDQKIPRRVFAWNQLENIYFRDRKFSVEVHDAKRSSSIPRRMFSLSSVNVLSWSTESAQQAKTLWTMAIAQHQFCIDLKKAKVASVRSSVEIPSVASKLDLRTRKPVRGRHGRSWSASFTLTSTKFALPISSKVVERELVEALKARKAALEEELEEKIKSLTRICVQEASITGQFPKDIPPDIIDPEKAKLNGDYVNKPTFVFPEADEIEAKLKKLENDLQLQKRISSAYESLVNCDGVDKQLQKSRQESHRRAFEKLKCLDAKLRRCQVLAGKSESRNNSSTGCPFENPSKKQIMSTASCSSPDLTTAISSHRSRSNHRVVKPAAPSALACDGLQSKCRDLLAKRHSVVDPTASINSILPLNSISHCQVIESVNDMALYNLKTHKTTNYSSAEKLDSYAEPPPGRLNRSAHRWPSKHASLEGAYRRGGCGRTDGGRIARNLSSGCLECQELYTENGAMLPDRSSLSSILDMTCEDDTDNDTFQFPTATRESSTTSSDKNRRGDCCRSAQNDSSGSVSARNCLCRNGEVPERILIASGDRRQKLCVHDCRTVCQTREKLPFRRENSDSVVAASQDTVGVEPTTREYRNCVCRTRSGRSGKVSRSNSCFYEKMAKKWNVKVDVPPGDLLHDRTNEQTPHRARSHSLHARSKFKRAELVCPPSSTQVLS